jgi:hypothetical protein
MLQFRFLNFSGVAKLGFDDKKCDNKGDNNKGVDEEKEVGFFK